uniref:Sortilin-related VPS10 domain containing receptor 2 n=1 Tax=Mus spicilegus TaxID=10103 RepID=A0A8C6I483_MUSSI
MAHRGPPSAPKRPGPTAPDRSFQALLPPFWPRSWPLLLLLVLVAACGAMGRSPQPGRQGPGVQITRLLPAGHTESGDRKDPQARESEPSVPGLGPGSASGPSTDGAPAPGKGRRARAVPVAGAASASRAQVSLISTSFVLKGDATHNQAMVHWTGENSSVILILTKYYHADMGKVLESSLWRSSDFGTTYTKLTLQPGVTTVIDNFYICPANKRKHLGERETVSKNHQEGATSSHPCHDRCPPPRICCSRRGY